MDLKKEKKAPNKTLRGEINKTLRNKGQIIQAHPNQHETWHSF